MFRSKIKTGRNQLALAISTATALLAGYGNHALAAQAAPALEEVTITGSRISRDIGFESPVPVTSLLPSELRMFEPGLGVAQQLENLPQFYNNVSSDNIANRVTADVGQSQLNMRGMGGARTLVLLDGSRVVPSDRRSSVSVDYLPSTLIQRVDVVTGGASAAYGADALAGVTNFILNRRFTGLDLAFSTGINEQGDGEYDRSSLTWGDDYLDGQLHMFGSLELRENDAYRRENAEWDNRAGYVKNPAWVTGAPAGVPLRLTKDYVYPTTFSPTGLILQTGSALNRMQFNETGTGVVAFGNGDFSSLAGQPGTMSSQVGKPGDYQYDLFVRGHTQSLERVGVEAQTGFLGGDFELSENTTFWGHALYGRTLNTPEPSSSGASGIGLGHAGLAYMTVYPENPYLPASVKAIMTTEKRANIRVDQHGMLDVPWGTYERPEIVNRMWSFTGGFDHDLGGDWNLRGSYQYGEAQKHNENVGWERFDRFYLAMDAVPDPVTGTPICRIQLVQKQLAAQGRNLETELRTWALANSRVYRTDAGVIDPAKPQTIDYPIAVDSIDGTIKDCVPVNMFGKGLQSKAAMDYIHSSRSKTGISGQEQHFGELLANGTVFEGWGPGAITAAVGATYRKEHIAQTIVDTAIDALGPPYNVTLPDGTVAIRGIAPSISGGTDNLHRFSGQPVFSGGFNVKELFVETIIPLFASASGAQYAELNLAGRYADYSRAGKIDVWKAGLSIKVTEDLRLRGTLSHDIREGTFEELFVQQGRGANVTDPWNSNISYTTFNLTGGNPDLKAEEARTKVMGFVYQPSFLEGFSVSLDGYDVALSSAIGNLTEQATIDECFKTGALCDKIEKGTDGLIKLIRVNFININAAKVSGYDMETSYRLEPDFFDNQAESMNFRLIGGYMTENSSTPLNGSKTNQAGSASLPQKTVTANLMYTIGDVGINLQNNWVSASKRNVTWIQGVDVDDNSVPSYSYSNMALFWNGTTDNGEWSASMNVNNLFDKDPIIAGPTRVGDDLGRRYSLGFSYSFK